MATRSKKLPLDINGHFLPVVELGNDAGDDTEINTSGTSQASGVLQSKVIVVSCTAACRIKQGQNPTAAATSRYLPAGVLLFLNNVPGNKIAVIQESATGKFSISETEEETVS